MLRIRFSQLTFVLVMLTVLAIGCTSTTAKEADIEATGAAIAAQNKQLETQQTQEAELATHTAAANQHATETAVAATTTAQANNDAATATAEFELARSSTATAVAQITATAEQIALESTQTAVALAEKRAILETTATAQAFTEEKRNMVRLAKENSPIFGPAAGELLHEIDKSIESDFAHVEIQDFVAEVIFAMEPNPNPLATRDCGFRFRVRDDMAWSLVVVSSGKWSLIQQTGDDMQVVASGDIPHSTMAENNKMTLYVDGSQGIFFINGNHIADLPLANWQANGDISVGVEFFPDNEANDERTQYENFTIWPLEEIEQTPSPQAQPPVPAATPVPAFDSQGFINDLNEMRLIVEQMGGLLDRLYRGESQSCGEFMGYYLALQNRPAHPNLPTDWHGIYNEYNFVADNIINTNQSIKTICEQGGGYMSELDYGVARQGIGVSLDRINRALQAANQLSGG